MLCPRSEVYHSHRKWLSFSSRLPVVLPHHCSFAGTRPIHLVCVLLEWQRLLGDSLQWTEAVPNWLLPWLGLDDTQRDWNGHFGNAWTRWFEATEVTGWPFSVWTSILGDFWIVSIQWRPMVLFRKWLRQRHLVDAGTAVVQLSQHGLGPLDPPWGAPAFEPRLCGTRGATQQTRGHQGYQREGRAWGQMLHRLGWRCWKMLKYLEISWNLGHDEQPKQLIADHPLH